MACDCDDICPECSGQGPYVFDIICQGCLENDRHREGCRVVIGVGVVHRTTSKVTAYVYDDIYTYPSAAKAHSTLELDRPVTFRWGAESHLLAGISFY